jgi:hypothetical protein
MMAILGARTGRSYKEVDPVAPFFHPSSSLWFSGHCILTAIYQPRPTQPRTLHTVIRWDDREATSSWGSWPLYYFSSRFMLDPTLSRPSLPSLTNTTRSRCKIKNSPSDSLLDSSTSSSTTATQFSRLVPVWLWDAIRMATPKLLKGSES